MFKWANGEAHNLPEDFEIAVSSVLGALRQWYQADSVARARLDKKVIPPLRLVNRKDFKEKKQKGKFSQSLKPMVMSIERLLERDHAGTLDGKEVWDAQKHGALTDEQFDALWEKAKGYLPTRTAGGRKIKNPEGKSMTYARKVYKKAEATQGATTG